MTVRSRRYLLLLVFVAGGASLGLELLSVSLLAPYFGASRLVWANVIGLTLIYLALGYVLGGRVADRTPKLPVLCSIIALAGLFTATIPVAARPILHWSLLRFATGSGGIFIGSLLGVLALFAVPVILLGMVSPFAIRLEMRDVRTAGSTAGSLYAFSTVGSIAGAFLPTLLLTPLIGTARTVYLVAALLLAAALPGLWSSRRVFAAGAIAALLAAAAWLLAPGGAIKPAPGQESRLLYEGESLYNYIQVISQSEAGSDEISLRLNEGAGIQSRYRTAFARSGDPRDLLTHAVWDFFNVAPYVYPHRDKASVRSLALIGLGGGTLPKQFLAIYGSDARIDGIEIDPRIIEVGRAYFDMEDGDPRYPNYRTHAQDGRVFLTLSKSRYDVIGVDAYRPPYIPFHLTTREFFETVRGHLTADGVAVLNVTNGIYRLLGDDLASTMRSVFPQVFLIETPGAANTLIVAVNRPVGDGEANFASNRRGMRDPMLREIMAGALESTRYQRPVREWTGHARVFTDDWAPIDSIIDEGRLLRRLREFQERRRRSNPAIASRP